MNKIFSIIGGDEEFIKLAELLSKDGNLIKTFLLENAMFRKNNILKYSSIEDTILDSDFVICSGCISDDKQYILGKFSSKRLSINKLKNELIGKKIIATEIPLIIKNDFNIEYYKLEKNMELTAEKIKNTIYDILGL